MFKFCALIVMVAVFGSAIPSFAAQGQKQIRPVLQRTSMHDGLLAVLTRAGGEDGRPAGPAARRSRARGTAANTS